MHKVALLLSAAAVMVAALGLVPVAVAKKHKEDGARGLSVADNDENDISVTGGGKRAEAAANDYVDGQRFPERYATEEAAMAAAATKAPKQSTKQHNAKLLNRLGMKRVRTSGGAGAAVDGGNTGVGSHHRKRLASQSRSKYGADGGKGGSDSQMFIVKLPPHAHFYGDSSAAAAHQMYHQQQPHPQTPYKSLNTVPVGFVSNGKPAKVYHWNLPVIKHALGGNRYRSGGTVNDVAQQQLQLHQLQYGDFELPSSSGSKVMPRRTLYYKPRASGKPVKKSFVNNGKPNGFYVVSAGKNAAAAAAVPQYHKIVKAYYGSGDD